ncbi:hypothetical protein C2S52_014487 [Perilla frutescens var. hirtella]|nr:hypothetical protein C2S52_014487 [Perilla frutescens var. hirtella]
MIIFFPPAATYSSNETDLRSLLAFKSAIDLDPQGALISWNETVHFCSWNGIQCGRRHPDRVVAMNLRSQGLTGSLSPHLGNLSLLRSINLQNNTFHGLIPQEITLLRRLQYVEFSNNSFIGPVPQNLSNCHDLVYLNLIDNNLSGAIPIELGSMSKLEALGLSRNKFSGSIPPFLANITSLKKLSLLGSGMGGAIPASFAQLRNLKFLQLGENRLTGTVPSGLFNLSFMEVFSVSTNNLDGSIPSTIGLTLPNLKALYLFENKFTGPVPISIANASLLERVQVYDNYFNGPVPGAGGLVHLQIFEFHSNLIADDAGFILSSLTNSSELVSVGFGSNLLTGSLPESMSNLSKKIIDLHFEKNKIHGKIPSGIGNINSLAEFSVAENFLEGQIPMDFARLSNLRSLYLERNMFSDELKFSFGNLSFLTRLHLHENNLSGNVPTSLASCTNLLELDLSRNNFHGFIPRGVLNLSPISVVLNLSYNALEGSIPDEVGSLTNLAALDLSNNNLSGVIPSSLSKCISLEKLYLHGNLLEGEIPLGLSALVGLQELDLSMNNLSGQIPTLLGKLKLQKLNLSFNRLQGEVPIIGVFKNRTSISVEGNDGLCGGISELKLPQCPSVVLKKKNLPTLMKMLIPTVFAGCICLATLITLIFIYKQKLSRKKVTPPMPSPTGIQIMRFSYSDLFKSTDGFSEANLLGFGKFGSVYEGIVGDDQMVIAVKVLDLSVRGASRSFMAECNALKNVRHRNLLKILSVCESLDFQGHEFKALVYEFKANGSLEKWLHQNAESINFNMMQRFNIAIDIAQAVEYLHFGTDFSIAHGDLKPSNILLDEGMTAYVGDFGLAKIISDIIPSQESNSSIGIRGTIGYVPPEYGMSCPVSTQGDVYSYGIVLLEMFTNIRPTDDLLEDHVNLHSLVSAALPDRVMEVVDPQLQALMMNNDRMKSCMTSILRIGVSCSKEMPRERMPMTDVVIQLRKIHKLLSVREE